MSKLTSKHQQWYLNLLKSTRSARTKAYWLSFFSNMLAMALPIYVLQVYDKVIFYQNLDTLTGLLLGILLVIAFEFGFRTSRARILRGIATHHDVFSASALFRHMLTIPMRELEKRSTVDWNTLFVDLDRIRNRLSGPMAVGFMDFPFAFFMLFVMYIIAKPVFMVPVVFIVIVLAVIWRSDVVMQRNISHEQKDIQHRSTRIADLVGSRQTIKACNMDSAAFNLWAKSQTSVIDRSLVRGANHDFYESLGQTIVLLSSVILIALGAMAIIESTMTMGGLIAANMLSGRAMGSMVRMIGLWRAHRESVEAERRLDSAFAVAQEHQQTPMRLLNWTGKIHLDKASFGYGEGTTSALDSFAGTFVPGNFYGIIGPNGGGKSTLLKVMRGLYACSSGRVLLDKMDIRQFTQADLAQQIGYLPQEPNLISDTIYNNLTFGTSKAISQDEIKKACEYAGCLDSISLSPDGFNTLVSERDTMITPGMRQKLALARLYLRQPIAILMDEPTNHLDQSSLSRLCLHLKEQAKSKLVVVVSHHIGLLKLCDNLVIIEDGKLKQSGTTKVILKRLGITNDG